MAAETQYTANIGMVTINTANSNLDGTGSLGTVLTAASNGTTIKSVTIKAVGSTSAQGMIRLFVYDGANSRLFEEIEVPIVTQSASDACFEHYLPLDLTLKAGYLLKASTQVADTFNIIAEGIDWTYYTPDVRPESANYTANVGNGVISTANTSLTGSGSTTTILTASSATGFKGCLIKTIVIKATSSPTVDGMVRLFIQDSGGSTTMLFTEVPIPIITYTSLARSFVHQINFPDGFNLKAGYKIIASTEKANSFVVTAEGMDWKYPSSGVNAILEDNFTPASGTAVTTEEILQSHQLSAGVVASGDLLEVYASLLGVSAGNKTFRLYANTSNVLAGATLLGQLAFTTGNNPLSRFFPVVSDTAFECLGGSSNYRSQYATSSTSSANITVPSVSAGFWIIISGEKATGGDTDTVRWSMVRSWRA